MAKYGPPEIMNAGQGSQFTGRDGTDALSGAGVEISMHGRGRRIGNRMIERLRRSLTYEGVCLNAFETGSRARSGIGRWIDDDNTESQPPHTQSHNGILTPEEASETLRIEEKRAA